MAVNFAQTCAIAAFERLQQVFQTIDAQSCPRSFNFHMHTVYSDGKLQPEAVIDQAIAIGLQGLAITDHHTVSGYQAALRYLEDWKWNNPGKTCTLEIWSGVEINANLLGIRVHILGYGFDPAHPSVAPYLRSKITREDSFPAADVIADIQTAGGLAVLAHPVRYNRSPTDLIPAAAQLGINGVETYYAYNNPNPWKPSPKETQVVQQLAATHNLLSTCGTDTHGLNLLKRL